MRSWQGSRAAPYFWRMEDQLSDGREPGVAGLARSTTYARRLGVFDGTMLVMGGIVGAGIFLNPSVVAQRVGTPALTVGVWVLGGVIALAGA